MAAGARGVRAERREQRLVDCHSRWRSDRRRARRIRRRRTGTGARTCLAALRARSPPFPADGRGTMCRSCSPGRPPGGGPGRCRSSPDAAGGSRAGTAAVAHWKPPSHSDHSSTGTGTSLRALADGGETKPVAAMPAVMSAVTTRRREWSGVVVRTRSRSPKQRPHSWSRCGDVVETSCGGRHAGCRGSAATDAQQADAPRALDRRGLQSGPRVLVDGVGDGCALVRRASGVDPGQQ